MDLKPGSRINYILKRLRILTVTAVCLRLLKLIIVFLTFYSNTLYGRRFVYSAGAELFL